MIRGVAIVTIFVKFLYISFPFLFIPFLSFPFLLPLFARVCIGTRSGEGDESVAAKLDVDNLWEALKTSALAAPFSLSSTRFSNTLFMLLRPVVNIITRTC